MRIRQMERIVRRGPVRNPTLAGAFYMAPSNDHERTIAAIVDRISIEGRLDPTAVSEIAGTLGFMMSRSDTEFLVNHVRWRMDNPKRSEKPG